MTGSISNALIAHAQTLLSCLKQAALDRLRVRLNVILFAENYQLSGDDDDDDDDEDDNDYE